MLQRWFKKSFVTLVLTAHDTIKLLRRRCCPEQGSGFRRVSSSSSSSSSSSCAVACCTYMKFFSWRRTHRRKERFPIMTITYAWIGAGNRRVLRRWQKKKKRSMNSAGRHMMTTVKSCGTVAKRRGVAGGACYAQPLAKTSTCQFDIDATEWQARRCHQSHLHDNGDDGVAQTRARLNDVSLKSRASRRRACC